MKNLAVLSISALFVGLASAPGRAQNCAATSVGFTPIDDLGTGTYLGEQGGLYPGGANTRPAAHEAGGLAQNALIVPRDASGTPSAAGSVVFVSIGMSNATQEFSTFKPLSDADSSRAPEVVVVDAAQGGQAIEDMDDPTAPYWVNTVPSRLAAAGVTAAQVQVVWLKNANRGPTDPFLVHTLAMKEQFVDVLEIIGDTFPNAKICYIASRIYAGYATSGLNPEPFAYEQGFAMKWLIEDQIDGRPELNWDPAAGPVEAPWLSWGTYNWADGLVPRSDGLIWECSDFAPDGTHPGPDGRTKVATMLLDFLHADTSAAWYRGEVDPGDGPGVPFCFGDGTSTTCPCNNLGAAGNGCENSAGTGGANLDATGDPVLNDIVLHGTGFPPMGAPTVIVIRSENTPGSPPTFGDGVRCVGAPVTRMAATFASGGTSDHPINHGAGAGLFHFQLWYRNAASFCTPQTFNLSNGYSIAYP